MIKKDNIQLTIITVCYNSQDYIERCINSIIPQLTDEIEYLIIDGKSNDNTLDIIKRYDNYLRFVSEKDNGIYDAMNKGIKLASGKWILFINSDDILIENKLSNLIEYSKEYDDYDCIYSDIELIYSYNNNLFVRNHNTAVDLKLLNKSMVLHHQSMICKKNSMLKVNGFDTKYKIAADWDMMLKMRNSGMKFKKINYIFSRFYFGGASSKKHLHERHLVRKNNKCYKILDFCILIDIIHSLELRRKYSEFLYKNNDDMLMKKRGFTKIK